MLLYSYGLYKGVFEALNMNTQSRLIEVVSEHIIIQTAAQTTEWEFAKMRELSEGCPLSSRRCCSEICDPSVRICDPSERYWPWHAFDSLIER